MHNIKNIYKNELASLFDAVENSKNLYHTFTFTSINNNFPESRTVVLRDLELDPLKIYFNTDYRSPKIKELINNDLCSTLFYDQKRKVQLRFKCKAVIHYDNDMSKKAWKSTTLQSRKCYMAPYSPSELLDDWHPNIPLEYLKKDPDEKHSQEGYANFAHIELIVLEADVLELHHDGHVRFKVKGDDLFYISA